MTLAKILTLTNKITKRFLVSSDVLLKVFELVNKLIMILEKTKYDKTFCGHCQTNIGNHEIYNLGFEFSNTVNELNSLKDFEKHSKESSASFGRLIASMLVAVTNIDCNSKTIFQRNALNAVRNFFVKYQTKELAGFAIAVVPELLRKCNKVKLDLYSELYLLQRLFALLKAVGNIAELIRVGLFYIPIAIAAKEEDSNMTHNMVYDIVMAQRSDEFKGTFFTPYDYLTKNPVLHGVKLPSTVNFSDVHLVYLKIGNCYVTLPKEFNDKVLEQLLKMEPTVKHLQFALFVPNFSYKKFEERICAVINRGTVPNAELNAQSIGLLKGVFKLADYRENQTQMDTKWKTVSMTTELSKKSSELFTEQNLQYEHSQRKILLYTLSKFTEFVEFYLAISADEKPRYKWEITYLMSELMFLSRQFSMRTYDDEAMKLSWLLYRLSVDTKHELNEINACSHFAENHQLYQSVVVKGQKGQKGPDLTTLLDECYSKIVSNLEAATTLSKRKQNRLYICLLNIAHLYIDQGHIDDAKSLLKFVYLKSFSKNETYDGVRLKYDFVLLKMVSKNGQRVPTSIYQMSRRILNNIRKNPMIVYDDSYAVADVMYKTIVEMAIRCYHRYQPVNESEKLLLWMVKFASHLGLVLRAARALLLAALLNLAREKVDLLQVSCFFLTTLILVLKRLKVFQLAENNSLKKIIKKIVNFFFKF